MLNKAKMKKINRLVVKFGGSSLADGSSISRAVDSVVRKAEEGAEIVVVVSAMGKTTDLLIESVSKACVESLSADELDNILAMGELTSARIFAAAVRARGLECYFMDPHGPNWPIVTDASSTNAEPVVSIIENRIKEQVLPLLEKGAIVVVPGFVGRTERGMITTMGRGGSDITALLLAHGLHASQVILVTDVEGIMTADPKMVGKAEKLDKINLDVLVGLADSGIKFIHKKALRYKDASTDIKVISNRFGNLDVEGTLIRGSLSSEMIVELYRDLVMAVTLVGIPESELSRTLFDISEKIKEVSDSVLGLYVDRGSLILYLSMSLTDRILESFHSIVIRDKRAKALAVRKDLVLVRVKGVGLEETPGVIGKIARALESAKINIYGIFTVASSIQLFVDLKDKDKSIKVIEEAIKAN